MSVPVLFLTFSNDTDDHLPLLKVESRDVFRSLRDLDRQEFVKVHREENVDAGELFDTLVSFKDRIAIFHYGGHADGRTLRLEESAGHATGIAQLLGEQANLKLVFLNGCATLPQVELLMAAGVKAVIATSVPIRDDKATEFAVRFYDALAGRRTIGQAFGLAQAFLETRYGDRREISVVPMREVPLSAKSKTVESIPWGLYVKEEHRDEVLNWKLPYYRAIGLPQDMIQYIGSSFTTNRYVMLVLDEMARYNPDIYSQMTEQRSGETVKRDSREYPELIIRNFPWPLGSQVRLLRLHDSPGTERVEHLVSAYVRTTQLLYYILLSDLWEQRRRGRIAVLEDFDPSMPMDARTFVSFDFLTKTNELFRHLQNRGMPPYVAEFESVADAWDDADGPLRKAHAWLEQLRAELPTDSPPADLDERCRKAEQALSAVLKAGAFLARYRMLTVRNIAVEAPRFEAVTYELDMGPLNATDNSTLSLYQDAAHRRKTCYGNSHSVVLARDEEKLDDCLNLSPFVIDKNTFVSVKKSETTDKDRLAHIFVLSYEERGRLVYLAVEHGLSYALANDRDRIHTDMTREDFTEGRNLIPSARAAETFDLDASFGVEPHVQVDSQVKVFQQLRDQFDAFIADLRTSP